MTSSDDAMVLIRAMSLDDHEKMEAADYAECVRMRDAGEYADAGPVWDFAVKLALNWLSWRAPEWTNERRARAAMSLSAAYMNFGEKNIADAVKQIQQQEAAA